MSTIDVIINLLVWLFWPAWLVCAVFTIRNYMRIGVPRWEYCLAFLPWANFVFLALSFGTLNERQAKQAQEAQRKAQRIAQAEVYRLDEPRRQEEARRRQADLREAEQRALSLRLTNLVSVSTETAAELRNRVQLAENWLDHAEREFKDGVFAPFWDAVEQAANQLAQCEVAIQRLIQNSTSYNGEARKLATPPPRFQLTLPDASHTASRMRSVVRRAQKDFHFATIYEQRKTNQLLVAGFSTLGQAINELGGLLDSSLERLASSFNIGVSDLTSAQQHMESALVTQSELSRKQAASEAAAQGERDKELDKKLDNIQRRKRPMPPGLRDGEY